jgi:hypothetical protein
MKKLVRSHYQEITAFTTYLILTLVFTFPLVFKMSSSIYGYTSDNFSGAWYFWWLKYAQMHDLDPNFVSIVGYPFGSLYGALISEDLWMSVARVLTMLVNELFAYNFLFLLSFPLAGLGMYLLTDYLWRNKFAAFWAGLVFGFAPYHFWQGYAHLSLALIQTLPFYFLALINFDRKKSYLSAVLLSLAFIMVVLTTFYYGFFMALLTVVYLSLRAVQELLTKRNYFDKQRLKLMFISAFLVTIASVPLVFNFYLSKNASTSQTLSSTPQRTLDDFLSLSLRPWDLLLPAPDHPILGGNSKKAYGFIRDLSSDYKTKSAFLPERVVYVGFTTFGLFLLSLWFLRQKKESRKQVLFLTALLAVVTAFSLPPVVTVKGINIYFPSYLIYSFAPSLRVLVRLGIVILMIMTLISAYSLKTILEGAKLKWKQWSILATFSALVIFEFLPIPPIRATEFDKPPLYYQFIRDLPSEAVVAEYPPKFDMADSLIWQRYHEKKLFNMFNTEYHVLWDHVHDLAEESHADLLSAMGVDYVLFHTAYLYSKEHPFDELFYTRYAEPPTIERVEEKKVDVRSYPWLSLEKDFNDARVYKLGETNSKVAVYNPKVSEEITWVEEPRLELTKPKNYIYIFNLSSEEYRALFSFETEDPTSLTKIIFNGIQTAQLNGGVIRINKGVNIFQFESAQRTDLKNLSLVKVKE